MTAHSKRNTKQDRLDNPQEYTLHPTKGYRRERKWVRQYIRMGEALFNRLKVTQGEVNV